MVKHYCACCGYAALVEPAGTGSFDICPICFWEDDPVQFNNLDLRGGANRCSLRQARLNFEKLGASEPEMLKHVRRPTSNDSRDPNWSPK